ncbi:CNH domain-containing protein [Aspergillus venezuelensis]
MANYHNGNQQYGQPGNQQRYEAYSPPSGNPPLRRMPSYNAGDDASLFAPGGTQNSTPNHRYTARASIGDHPGAYGLATAARGDYADPRYSHLPSATSSPPRARAQSQSAYQYQYTSAANPMSPTQTSYNPQQYALPNTQQTAGYTPLSYSSSNNSYGNNSNTSPGHQPYNPAAYQATNIGNLGSPTIQRQSSMLFAQTPLSPYGTSHPSLPPPPPPRGPDHPYGGRPSPQFPNTSPGTQFGFTTQPSQSSFASSSYSLASPTSPSTAYASASGSFSSMTSFASRPYGGVQIPSHLSHRSSRLSDPSRTPSVDEEPPEPPAHQSSSDLYDKPYHSVRPPARSLPTPPLHQTQSGTTPRRTDTLTRHPQARPLPGPPVENDDNIGSYEYMNGAQAPAGGYDELVKEVEAAMPNAPWTGGDPPGYRPLHIDIQSPDSPQRSGSTGSGQMSGLAHISPDETHTHTNGNMATGTGQYVNYDAYSDDSDAEAEAGLAMMRMADEEERAQAERLQERTRRETIDSTSPGLNKRPSVTAPSPVQTARSDRYSSHGGNNYLGHSPYDEKTLGRSPYGDDSDQGDDRPPTTLASRHSSNASREERAEYSDEYDYPPIGDDFSFPFPQLPSTARVDAGGTGGLSEPSAYNRRMSFDYGDETDGSLSHRRQSHHSGSEGSIGGEEPVDLFFHPGMRPLPPPPEEPTDNATLIPHLLPAGTYRHQESGENQYTPSYIPAPSPDSYGAAAPSPTHFSRSTSLTSHPIGPRADPPIRSKTDADKAKYKQEMLRQSMMKFDPSLDPSSAAIPLDLPMIPAGRRKKFHPAKLSSEDFRRCSEPWALSSILSWIRDLTEDETDLKEHAVAEAIVALFTHKVPTMNIADAETLAARVVENMLSQDALVKDEEWVKFGSGSISGVLFQITGSGCYSTVLHEQEMDAEVAGRCYSHHCMRTLRKVNLRTQAMEPQKKAEDWVTFYKVTKEILEGHPKKEIDRQNNLHEIVTTEDSFIGQLDVLRELYRDRLATSEPSIIPPKRSNKFLHDVFGKVDAVKRVNEDFLLAQLKYRQKEQGPFINGFSDIFREWIRKAKAVYISYAETFPYANYLIRKEAERNVVFRQFLSTARDHKLSNRLSWDTFLKSPITRIQRYTLLLSTVHRNMLKDSEEKTNLAQAIEEIKIVALECDNKVGEMSKKVDLRELASKLQLRPDMRKRVELNLDFLGREIIFRGDLQRPGSRTRFLVDTHAILFDHFLVLAKLSVQRDTARTIKLESYDVSKLPIPMDLLVLESTNEDPVVRSAVRGVVAAGPAPQPGVLANANADRNLVPATVLENTKDGGVLYPFKVKHLGLNEIYTLYAPSSQNRRDWCEKITEAKTKHAASLYAQNAEPFHLRVLADTAFASNDSSPSSNGAVIKGTPLYRAVKEVEKQYPASARPTPICRAAVHCATVFEQPPGRKMCAIGTDYGVYISEYSDPRGWTRAIAMARVTQIAVFEEFNLFLLIADKSLIAYHLDVVCPTSGVPAATSNDSARRAPQKLSGNREVGFFAAGHMKDRTLVMYKKRDGLSSTFKILEPVLQKSATSRGRFFSSRRSQTEFFREYDEFYIPAESYGINLFHSSLAISTQKGIEILTLDKKQTWSVPEFRTDAQEAQQHLLDIARRITGLRPLGMFRLSDAEFLVTYTECAVYVNQHGDVSRSVVLEFVGRAHSACLYGKFLILFNDDFVEVRNAMNGRLRQVIPGHNVVCLDDGSRLPGSGANSIPTSSGDTVNLSSGQSNGASLASQGRTVKICMQHPDYPRNLIVLELIENEGSKD